MSGDAIDKWIKNYERDKHRHNLILYSDQLSLKKLLDEIDKLTQGNWFKSYCGPVKHYGIHILDKKKWFDAARDHYKEFLYKPQETAIKVLDNINRKIEESRIKGGSRKNNSNLLPLIVTFLVEDISREESVKKAAGVWPSARQSIKRCQQESQWCPALVTTVGRPFSTSRTVRTA